MAKATKPKKNFIPEDPVTDAMIDQVVSEEAQDVDPDAQFRNASALEAAQEDDSDMTPEEKYQNKMYNVKIPFQLRVGKKTFAPGIHTVNRGLAQVLTEMTDKKRRADMSVYVGKNRLVQRLLDRTLVITEVEKVDLGTMSRR